MKKRILILGVVLALLLAMVLPTAALADTTVVTGSVAATSTVTSVYITGGGTICHSCTGTPAITITGTNFVHTVSEYPVTTVTIATGTGTVVGVGAVTVVSITSITTTFTQCCPNWLKTRFGSIDFTRKFDKNLLFLKPGLICCPNYSIDNICLFCLAFISQNHYYLMKSRLKCSN